MKEEKVTNSTLPGAVLSTVADSRSQVSMGSHVSLRSAKACGGRIIPKTAQEKTMTHEWILIKKMTRWNSKQLNFHGFTLSYFMSMVFGLHVYLFIMCMPGAQGGCNGLCFSGIFRHGNNALCACYVYNWVKKTAGRVQTAVDVVVVGGSSFSAPLLTSQLPSGGQDLYSETGVLSLHQGGGDSWGCNIKCRRGLECSYEI